MKNAVSYMWDVTVFGDIECLPGEYKIKVEPNVAPVIHPPRMVPLALRHELRAAELERMMEMGIISKVDTLGKWVSSICIGRKKNGDLRICLDSRDLNKAIIRKHIQLPTAEEIMSQMGGAKIFSKVDVSTGSWQIKVNTPFGHLKFNRLPFGVSCASEAFSQKVEGLEELHIFNMT